MAEVRDPRADLGGVRIAIVGAGLGGLCLAQGLRQAGADVVVYEQDVALNASYQGYRLHLDARAGLALQHCLPPALFALFLATCGRPSTRFTVLTERLRILHEIGSDPDQDPFAAATLSTSVNRQTLREILALGLDARLEFGRELTGYADHHDEITLDFADGTSATADVLVGADGVHSVVRRLRLPDAQVRDTGGRCIYGKTMLDESAMALMPAPMLHGFTAIVGGDVGMAAGLVQLRARPEDADTRLSPGADYLMWAVSGPVGAFGESDPRLSAMPAAELHGLATRVIGSWHRDLRALVARADVDQTLLVRVRASVPVEAWTPSRVTVLGDAIHAMSPARGSGANTALQDAGVLCRALCASRTATLTDAIGDYERQLRDYGFAAVFASQQAETETGARRHRLAFWLYQHLAGVGRPRSSRTRAARTAD